MSIYLYGFQPKGNITRVHYPFDNIEIFNLTFRTGNLGSLGNERYEDAISTKLERAWEGKALPEFFVIGKREEGGTVYKAQQPLFHAEWIDTNPLPGKAEPIGYLTKMRASDSQPRGRFRVILETKDERRERTEGQGKEDAPKVIDMVPMAWS